MWKTLKRGLHSLSILENFGLFADTPASAPSAGQWSAGQAGEAAGRSPQNPTCTSLEGGGQRAGHRGQSSRRPALGVWDCVGGCISVSSLVKLIRWDRGVHLANWGRCPALGRPGGCTLVFSCPPHPTPGVQLRRRLREPLLGQTTSKVLCIFISSDGL